MDNSVKQAWEIIRYDDHTAVEKDDPVAVEYPLTVTLNGHEFATMICSPTHLPELVTGFLASEGIIRTVSDIKSLQVDEKGGFAYVELYKTIDPSNNDHSKRVIGSCCGKSRQFYFQSDAKTAKTIMSHLSIHVDQCFELMESLQQQSSHFHDTGGVHNAALATVDGLIFIHTDIGRHNALDKIYGDILNEHIPLRDKLIVFSGRVSSEVLLKVSKIGIGIIISKSAPTNLALELANDLNITVIGFARNQKMNIYTHHQRIYEANDQMKAYEQT